MLWLRRLLTLIVASAVTLLLVEGGLRVVTDHPVRWESHRVPDALLGHRVDPAYGAIDADGFRNPTVPESARVVTLGDSHTFGHHVAAEASWPRQLADMLDVDVYNLGVGGYGFLQYDLLLDRALELSPRLVVLAVYPVNDFSDVLDALAQDHGQAWAGLRGFDRSRLARRRVRAPNPDKPEGPRLAITSLVQAWRDGREQAATHSIHKTPHLACDINSSKN